MNFLDEYVEYTRRQESPQIFHEWTALAILSAAIKRHVYFDRNFYKLYPNLYMILVASTAKSKKSTALDIGVNMLKKALGDKVYFFSQKESSPEALMDALGAEYAKSRISQGVIYADELAQFIAGTQQDARIVAFLTQVYGCSDTFVYHSLSRGDVVCSNLYPTIIAGTTVEWIKGSLPKYAVAGGFTGRIVFVHDTPDSRPIAEPERGENEEVLLQRLKEVHEVKGQMRWGELAREWYKNWYEQIHWPQIPDEFSQGFHNRKHDTLVKVATILALADRLSLNIEVNDLERALHLLNKTQKHLPTIMREIEATESGQNTEKVFRAVAKHKDGIEYAKLSRNLSYAFTAKELQELLESLVKEEKIRDELVTKDGKRVRVLVPVRHQFDT